MSLADVHKFFAEICLPAKTKLPKNLSRHLKEQSKERLLIYRQLTRDSIDFLLDQWFENSFKLIGKKTAQTLIAEFIAHPTLGPRSPHYHRVPLEFLDFLKTTETFQSNLRFAELAIWELWEYDCLSQNISCNVNFQTHDDAPLENAQIILNPTLHIGDFTHAVHKFSKKNSSLKNNNCTLGCWRNPDSFAVEKMVFTKLSAALIKSFLTSPKTKLESHLQIVTNEPSSDTTDTAIVRALEEIKTLVAERVILALV